MAFIVDVPTEFGIPATYHRVTGMQVYYNEKLVDVVFTSYLNESARADGKQPLGQLPGLRLTFDVLNLAEGEEPTRTHVYNALKRLAAEKPAEGQAPNALAPFAEAQDA